MVLLGGPLWGQNSYYCNDALVELEPVEGKFLLELSKEVLPIDRTQVLARVRALPGVIGVSGSYGRRTKLTANGAQAMQRAAALDGVGAHAGITAFSEGVRGSNLRSKSA